jgi:putative transposase
MEPTQRTEDMAGRRKRRKSVTGRIPQALVDEVLKEYRNPEDMQGLLKELTAAVVNRAMQGEMSHELGYGPGESVPEGQSNRRNGTTSKRVRTEHGEMAIEVPRDREGEFEPQLIPKHQRHFNGFDDKILAMYARGMSVRDIRGQLEEIYGVDVSADLISRVTDAVVDELRAWQSRPLEPVYCIVYLDALVAKIRDKSGVRNKSIYVAVGISPDGLKSVLGLWVQQAEGAKFWCAVMEQLRQRGLQDILVLCTDGLSGMAEAAEAIFPQTIYQTCIVHVIRSSTRFVSWKDRKAVCADLRAIYTAGSVEDAKQALDDFEAKWSASYPTVARSWRARWDEITPFLAYPAEIRRAIYTTNIIESLNRKFRKALKTKGHLPNEDAALKLLYLSLHHGNKTWGGRSRDWGKALNQFAIYFEGRLPQ